MGTIKQTIVLALLSFSAIFIACSDDNDPIIDPVVDEEQPADELDTYVLFSAGFGDEPTETRAMTKAEDPDYTGDGNNNRPKPVKSSYEDIYNYGIAIFKVNDKDEPTTLLSFAVRKSEDGKSLIQQRGTNDKGEYDYNASTDSQLHGHDAFGYNLMPSKFKTAENKIALIVIANNDKLKELKESNELDKPISIPDYDAFKEYFNSIDLPESEGKFDSYPMSSNIYIINITPGIVNGIGWWSSNGLDRAEKILNSAGFEAPSGFGSGETWKLKGGDPNDPNAKATYHLVSENRILLYRCWSKVNLKKVQVAIDKEMLPDAKAARFTLEEVFLMNVPKTVKMFNEEKKVSDNMTKKWGFQLGFDATSYLKKGFYSGYSKDTEDPKDTSTGLVDGKTNDRGFRNEGIATNTNYNTNYLREETEDNIATNITLLDLTDKKIESPILGEDGKYTFVISPSDYGVSITNTGEKYTERAIILSIKGTYEQQNQSGGWISYGSGYYSLVINDEKDKPTLGNTGILPTNIPNTVMRNVEYNINVTIQGPGSPTPVLHQPWTYIVPKITIVPFGIVEQDSKLD